jgi:hypothetical protein
VDKWTEAEVRNEETGDMIMTDVFEGEQKMEERYLGDIISTDGRNIKNIKTRIIKGTGMANKIVS